MLTKKGAFVIKLLSFIFNYVIFYCVDVNILFDI
jgi:hypothetical protein